MPNFQNHYLLDMGTVCTVCLNDTNSPMLHSPSLFKGFMKHHYTEQQIVALTSNDPSKQPSALSLSATNLSDNYVLL